MQHQVKDNIRLIINGFTILNTRDNFAVLLMCLDNLI